MSPQTLATAQLHSHDFFVCSQCPAACCCTCKCCIWLQTMPPDCAGIILLVHAPMPCCAYLTDSSASSLV